VWIIFKFLHSKPPNRGQKINKWRVLSRGGRSKHVCALFRLSRQPEVDLRDQTRREHQRLQTLLARSAQHQTATSAVALPVVAAGWEQPSLCTEETDFPVSSQTVSCTGNQSKKCEKKATYWYTQIEDDQSSNACPKSWEKLRKNFRGAQRAPKTHFWRLTKILKILYTGKKS
jgi:hypothetical protein